MKKCEKKRLKLNNAGMTLIELLVAIAIMAVALAPLLFAFVNSAKYNARAREIQQTTTLAHTVMENCKAYSLEEIKKQMTDITHPQYPFLDGVYATQVDVRGNQMYLTDVVAEDKKYDIVLDFNAHDFDGQSTYPIIQTENMNQYLDAVYSPMGTQILVGVDPSGNNIMATVAQLDQIAYLKALEYISDGIYADSGNTIRLTESFIEESFKDSTNDNYNDFKVSRETKILIWNPGDHEAVNVYVNYTFNTTDGKYHYTHTLPDGNEVEYDCPTNMSLTYNDAIYSNSPSNDATHPTKIENVYFFYYPGYKTVIPDPSNPGADSMFSFESDTFLVSNELADGSREVDVYLIKQKNPAYSDTSLGILEASYSTYVDCLYRDGITKGTNIYHNFDVNLGGGSSTQYNKDSWFHPNLEVVDELVPVDNKILMYDVRVVIYEAGAYNMDSHLLDSSAEPVLTMEGTTLNW